MSANLTSPTPTPSLARSTAVASLAVFGSRVMGLIREQLFAFFFGASREYDAFLTAFRIPNLLRDLLAEGALSAAFVPCFVQRLQTQGKAKAFDLANLVLSLLAVVLLLLVAAGIVWAPQLVGGIALGFDPAKAALTVQLTRCMFPYIFLVGMAAVLMGMLNAQGYFALPQSASTFFNLTSIAVGLSSAFVLAPQYMLALLHQSAPLNDAQETAAASHAMLGMALGTLCGGLAQCWVQWPSLKRTGFGWQWRWDLHDAGLRQVLRLMGPAILGAAAVQLNVFVNSNFASVLGDKPISWLNYAFRLMQFPIGLFGVAVVSGALPALARANAQKDPKAFQQVLTNGCELILLLTLPACLGLITLRAPIIQLIFEHGRFHSADTLATANALAAYALGLPAYALLKLIQPTFVTLGQATTPMYTSLAAVGLNASLNFLLVTQGKLGHVGLALSTSCMALLNLLVLLFVLEWRHPSLRRTYLIGQLLRISLAASSMAAGCCALRHLLHAVFTHFIYPPSSSRALLELLLIMPVAVLLYTCSAHLLRVNALRAGLNLLHRRRQR